MRTNALFNLHFFFLTNNMRIRKVLSNLQSQNNDQLKRLQRMSIKYKMKINL